MLAARVACAQKLVGIVTGGHKKGVEYATVILQNNDSTYIGSTLTDSTGRFEFQTGAPSFRIVVQHLLYTTFEKHYTNERDIAIELVPKENKIGEVVIKGERPIVRLSEGRIAYDIPTLLKGSIVNTAYEAILQLPGVREQNGILTLSGASSLAIVINGQASNMPYENLISVLKMYPVRKVKKAEVMYSAPPQYHVRGAAINLVLKDFQSSKELEGEITNTYTQKHYGSNTSGASLFYASPRINTDFNYSYTQNKIYSGLGLISHHQINGNTNEIYQDNSGEKRSNSHYIRLGAEFSLPDSQKISATYNSQITPTIRNTEYSNGSLSKSLNIKRAISPVALHNILTTYSYHSLRAGSEYTSFYDYNEQLFSELTTEKANQFTSRSKQSIYRFRLFTDYSSKLGSGYTISYGAQYIHASDYSSQTYQPNLSKQPIPGNTGSHLKEYTSNLYIGCEKNFGSNLSLKMSATAEYYKLGDYTENTLFPTVEATYIISPKQIVQLSVSTDKVYPGYWEMHGAIGYMNSYQEIHGNPELKPYRDYTSQLNFILNGKYIIGAFFSYLKDYFVQMPYQSPDKLSLIYQTINFNYKESMGINISIPAKIGDRISSKATIIGFYDKVKALSYHDISMEKDNLAFYSRLDNTIGISSKPKIRMEIAGAYISKNIQGPSELSSLWSMDAAISLTFAKEMAELQLRGVDLLNTWTPDMSLKYKTQDIFMRIPHDSRTLLCTLIFKFGGYNHSHKEVDISRFGTK